MSVGIKEDLSTHGIQGRVKRMCPPHSLRADDAAGLQNNCHQGLRHCQLCLCRVCLLHVLSLPTSVAQMVTKLPHFVPMTETQSQVPSLSPGKTERCVLQSPLGPLRTGYLAVGVYDVSGPGAAF